MGFSITWYIEKHALYMKLFDVVTYEEVASLNRQMIALTRTGIQPIDIIIDTLAVTEYPINLRWALHMMHDNPVGPQGWKILVQNNRTIDFIIRTILSTRKVSVFSCTTIEEAMRFLDENSDHLSENPC